MSDCVSKKRRTLKKPYLETSILRITFFAGSNRADFCQLTKASKNSMIMKMFYLQNEYCAFPFWHLCHELIILLSQQKSLEDLHVFMRRFGYKCSYTF